MLARDTTSEHLWARTGDTALDTWIFASDDRRVTDVWSAGRHMVKNGRHTRREAIVSRYLQTLDMLKDAI